MGILRDFTPTYELDDYLGMKLILEKFDVYDLVKNDEGELTFRFDVENDWEILRCRGGILLDPDGIIRGIDFLDVERMTGEDADSTSYESIDEDWRQYDDLWSLLLSATEYADDEDE